MHEYTQQLPAFFVPAQRQIFEKHRQAFLEHEFVSNQELECGFSMGLDAVEDPGGDVSFAALGSVWKPLVDENPYLTVLRARVDLLQRFPAFLPSILMYPRAFEHAYPLAKFRELYRAEYRAVQWLVESDDRWPILVDSLQVAYAIGRNFGSVPNGPEMVTAYTDPLSDYFDSLCCSLTGDDLVAALRLAARRNVLPLMHHPGTNLARLPADIARQVVEDLAQGLPQKMVDELREWAEDNRYRDRKPRQTKPNKVDESSLLRFLGDWNQIKLASGF